MDTQASSQLTRYRALLAAAEHRLEAANSSTRPPLRIQQLEHQQTLSRYRRRVQVLQEAITELTKTD